MESSKKPQKNKKQKQKKTKDPFNSTSIEAIEAQIALDTLKLAHRQIRDGTASSQVQTHFLKLASSTHKLEKAKLRGEIKLIDAKVSNLKEGQNTKELYDKAIQAMKSYGSAIISSSSQELDDEDEKL